MVHCVLSECILQHNIKLTDCKSIIIEQYTKKLKVDQLKANSNIFLIGLLIKTFKVTVTSVVDFLITCLVFEAMRGIFFLKKQLTSKLNAEIQLNLHVYTSYVNCELFKIHFLTI